MTACERFDALLLESLSGDLDPAQRAEFDGHVAGCALCLHILKGCLRSTAMAALAYPDSDEPTTPLPEPLVRSVLAYVRQHTQSSGKASGVA